MNDLKALCVKYFGTDDLYEIFGLEKTAAQNEVRKSYYKMAMVVHPDKVDGNKEAAEEKFKIIGSIYSILSDEDKRKSYDSTGDLDDVDFTSFNWYDYFGKIFKSVTTESINDYEKKYKGSEEEKEDLKAAYIKYKGKMENILETVLFGHPDEEDRYNDILLEMVESGDIPDYNISKNDTAISKKKRKAKYEKEEKMAKKYQKKANSENGKNDDGDGKNDEVGLMQAFANRRAERAKQADAFFKHLEEKYSTKKSKKGKK